MAIEDGSMSVDEPSIGSHARQTPPEGVSDNQIDDAFQNFITRHTRGTALKAGEDACATGYGIYLLSNTNPIMWNGVIAPEFAKGELRREDYFDGMVTYTADHLCIEPAETLFFDDSTANVEAARRLGSEAVHVAPHRVYRLHSRIMKTIAPRTRTIATVGTFDGCSPGHVYLLEQLQR